MGGICGGSNRSMAHTQRPGPQRHLAPVKKMCRLLDIRRQRDKLWLSSCRQERDGMTLASRDHFARDERLRDGGECSSDHQEAHWLQRNREFWPLPPPVG